MLISGHFDMGHNGFLTADMLTILTKDKKALSNSNTPMYLLDDCDLSKVASGATLNQRYVSCQAHSIHMVAGSWEETSVVAVML